MPMNRLLIFTRYPEPGTTKSRLIPALGAEGAARLQREMTRHTLGWARHLGEAVSVEVLFEGGDRQRMQACFGNELTYRPQGDGDLGARLKKAAADAMENQSDRVVIVGSDCPELSAELTRTAFDRLAENDLVLGPAVDGGYYLVGLGREVPGLFEGIDWGTDRVFEQTLAAARRLGLSVATLPVLADVDRPEDLHLWQRISVIIPTLNEAVCLKETLQTLRAGSNVETLLVDAGSTDATLEIARSSGATILQTTGGRARQMNAAAAAAEGQILLFLHADTRLPEQFDRHVRETLARPGVIGGAFRLRIAGRRKSFRLISRGANCRARFLRMPYGDQALFLRREVFESLGGFAEMPFMEDYEFVRRLRRRGQILLADAEVITSNRRWEALGPWRTTWINQMMVLGYHLGISPTRLCRWYHTETDR